MITMNFCWCNLGQLMPQQHSWIRELSFHSYLDWFCYCFYWWSFQYIMMKLTVNYTCNRFHSLHHTQFRANYSLFMPLYDYLFSTVDKTSYTLYETSLKKQDDSLDVVYLTHLTTPESIYHMRLGLASLASKPHHHASSEWYKWLLWPVTLLSMMITWIYGRTFVVERNRLNKLKLQTWAISKYNMQVRTKTLIS